MARAKSNTRKNRIKRKRHVLSKKHKRKGGSCGKHKKSTRRHHRRRRSMRGGGSVKYVSSTTFFPKGFNKAVPYLPKGGPYVPGANDNGLGKGFYYSHSGDLHAPNNFLSSTSNVNANAFLPFGSELHQGPIGTGQSGGGFIPQDLVDLGRNVVYSVKNLYAGYVGEKLPASADPNPTYQPDLERNPQLNSSAPNLNTIRTTANKEAANVQ
jgi:hypothetical protein